MFLPLSPRTIRARRQKLAREELSSIVKPQTLNEAVGWYSPDVTATRKAIFDWKKAIVGSSHLTSAEKLVAGQIASFINTDAQNDWYGTGWASQKTIAQKVGLTVRTVNSAFQTLRRLGLIVVEEGAGWRCREARTATNRFALCHYGLIRLFSVDRFERRLLAAYAECRKSQGADRAARLWEARGESEAGEIGNPSAQDRKSVLTININDMDVSTHPLPIDLELEYRVLCILVGAEDGEEYGRGRLSKLPLTLIDEYVRALAEGRFTSASFWRLLGHIRDCGTKSPDDC